MARMEHGIRPAKEEEVIPTCPTCGKLGHVGKNEELRLRILQGKADANVSFEDLCNLLRWLGFDERTRGSHHMFRRQGVRELINLQREGSKAKPYQVRQVRHVISRYDLEGTRE
jgi:predicted RNA binding protein YcfA (HicA-like mRNA interferase family)